MGLGSTIGRTLLDVGKEAIKPVGRTVGGGLEGAAKLAGFELDQRSLAASTKESTQSALGGLQLLWKRTAQSGRQFLEKDPSPTSKVLAQHIDGVEENAKQVASKYAERWDLKLGELFPNGVSRGDMEHVSDIVEGLVKAKSDRHLAAAKEWDLIMDEFSEQAQMLDLKEMVGGIYKSTFDRMKKTQIQDEITGAMRLHTDSEAASIATKAARRPFNPRENYVPHYYSAKAIADFENDPAKMEEAIKAVIRRGLTSDAEEASKIVKFHLRQPAEFRGGPLQHSRELDQFIKGGYEKDLRAVGARYFHTAARRLETAKAFGANDEIAKRMMSQIAAEGGNARIANNLYLAFADSANPEYRDLARITSTIHAITLLSTAGILQPSQIVNVAVRAGWARTLQGMATTIKDWKGSKAWAEHTGATLDTIGADMMVEQPTDLSKVWMRVIGLEQLDRYNRVVAAVTGRLYAQDLAAQFAKGGLSGRRLDTLLRQMEKMGISPEMAINQGGKLTHDQLRRAGYRLAKNTQFATQVLDMPEFRTTPAGRFVYLFKSFAFQQSRFIKDEIAKEAFMGNYSPWFTYAATIGPVGMMIAPLIREIKGREAPDNDVYHMLEDLAMVGSFGVFYDAARAIHNGPSSVVNWMAGPTFAEAMQVVTSDLAAIPRGMARGEGPDFQPMLKHATKRVPLIGQKLASVWFEE